MIFVQLEGVFPPDPYWTTELRCQWQQVGLCYQNGTSKAPARHPHHPLTLACHRRRSGRHRQKMLVRQTLTLTQQNTGGSQTRKASLRKEKQPAVRISGSMPTFSLVPIFGSDSSRGPKKTEIQPLVPFNSILDNQHVQIGISMSCD